jgi:superfamily II DNA or RNA helicase
MSATFRRNDGLENAWKFFIGDIIYQNKKKAKGGTYYQPITSNYGLSDAKFKMRGSGKLNHSKYITEITRLQDRNVRLAATIDSLVSAGRKVLVLSDRVGHLQELQKLIKTDSGMYVGSVDGKKVPVDTLKENAKKRVVLGTSGKIAEGSDIPDLDTLVICTPKSDVEQLVGRITREHPEKQEPYVIDPVLDTGYNRALARKREIFYHKLGFKRRTAL